MAAINDNRNLALSIADFRAASNGTHNVGELMLEGGTLQIVNNHVWKTGQNNTILSADQNRAVREALYNALANDLGDEGAGFLAKARSILLDGGNENQSLTRETVRLLCEGENSVKTADDNLAKSERTNEFRDSIDGKLKSLSKRHITRPIKGLMRSSRDAAFRLTINERCDKLRGLLARYYCQGAPNEALRLRKEYLEKLFFGTTEEFDERAGDNPELAGFREWLWRFDAKATDSEGKVLSDEQALDKLFILLAGDSAGHSKLTPEERKGEVKALLTELFDGKGGVGAVRKKHLESLLFETAEPVNETEEKVVGFRSWLAGEELGVEKKIKDGDSPFDQRQKLDAQQVWKERERNALGQLRDLLQPLSSGIKEVSAQVRRDAVESALASCDGKGGYGQVVKKRLHEIFYASPSQGDLTETEKKIERFKGWVQDFKTPMRDENQKVMSDEEALNQLKSLLKEVVDSVGHIEQQGRERAVKFVLDEFDQKGGYGLTVKKRLSAILFEKDAPDMLTDDEKKIAEFKAWVNNFDVPMKDGDGKAMSDTTALEQLKPLLSAKIEPITSISVDERKKAVQDLLESHFAQDDKVGQAMKTKLEHILDGGSQSVTSEEMALVQENEGLAEFQEWVNKFEAVVELEGKTLTDQETLDRIEALIEKLAKSIAPMSVEERQAAAKNDLEELFETRGGSDKDDYDLEMEAAKERLQTILFGDAEPDPASYRDETERSLGTIYRTWLHNADAAAEDEDVLGSEATKLSDREGRELLRDLLAKVAEGIAPKSLDVRWQMVQEKLNEKKVDGDMLARLEAILRGNEKPVSDAEEVIVDSFRGWLSDVGKMARDEMGRPLSDGDALEHLNLLLQPGALAEKKTRELLDGAVAALQKDKPQLIADLKVRYDAAWKGLAGELGNMKADEADALKWWQDMHQPDFAALWNEAIASGKIEIEDNVAADWKKLSPDDVKTMFANALNESLDALIGERINELKDMSNKVKGYMETLVAEVRSHIGDLKVVKEATAGQKNQVLDALPGELESIVAHYAGLRNDGDVRPNVRLCRLIVGDKDAEVQFLDEVEGWATKRLDEMRKAEAKKLAEFRAQVQDLQQECLQEGRKEALRKIAKLNAAFDKMALSDEDLEGSVGSYSGLSLDDVSKDRDIQLLLESQAKALQPSDLAGSEEKEAAAGQLKDDIVQTLVDKFTGTKNWMASDKISVFAKQIREAREAEFTKHPELSEFATDLTKGVVKELVGHFEGQLTGVAADKGLGWLSSENNPAEFDKFFSDQLFAYILKPVTESMSRVYVNRHAVTDKDVEQECERIFNATRDLLKGFGALYRNLAVDKKNYVSNLKVINWDVVVASTEGEVATVRAVMRREALSSLLVLLQDPNGYLNDVAKMKGEIFAAAVKVVDDPLVRRLWHTHQDENRNVKVREGLLEGLKG